MGWAARSLARSLGSHAEGSLPHPDPPPPPPPSPPTCLSAWRLPLLQLTHVLPLLGEVCVGLPKPGLISRPFPISFTSKRGGGGGGGGGRTSSPSKGWWEREVSMLIATQRQKRDVLMLLTAVVFHSSHK